MIKYFSHTFIGDILDGDRLGLDGPLAKDRRYPNERLMSAFENARDTAQLMEELGYDMMWLAEHHFQPEGYECIPNVLMLALWLAQHTERLKFGCAFNIAPMWHPLRLAEDFATVDVLTGGRVTFGVGRGYHTREVETFGMPMQDAEANRDLFEEQLEVILKAFNEESFSHRGKHYTIPPRGPVPGVHAAADYHGPQASPQTGGGLAAHRERQPARHRFHGQAWGPRHHGRLGQREDRRHGP